MNFIKRMLFRIKAPPLGDGPLKMVLVVRNDLQMSKGKTASQCAHAAVICYQRAQASDTELARRWFWQGQSKVVLRIAGQKELEKLLREAEERQLVAYIVHDAGRTEVKKGTATVLGVGPGEAWRIDEVTGHLRPL